MQLMAVHQRATVRIRHGMHGQLPNVADGGVNNGQTWQNGPTVDTPIFAGRFAAVSSYEFRYFVLRFCGSSADKNIRVCIRGLIIELRLFHNIKCRVIC